MRELAAGGSIAGDFYFDRNERRRRIGEQDKSDTWDLAIQHTFSVCERHKVVSVAVAEPSATHW